MVIASYPLTGMVIDYPSLEGARIIIIVGLAHRAIGHINIPVRLLKCLRITEAMTGKMLFTLTGFLL